jgi:glycosyltransferase involved in cell wall biosynthesis
MKRAQAIRVLALDIEGGYGGSSRSLYESLRHTDREWVRPAVWCRKPGPVVGRYQGLCIPCRVAPTMPKMNSLPRLSRNVVALAGWFRDFHRSRDFRDALLASINDEFDLVHFNHEGLFLLARWLRPRHAKPQTMHVRTMILDNAFGRWQCRQMAQCCDSLVFITENERDAVAARLGSEAPGKVIYNIAAPPTREARPHPAIPTDARLKIAVLSNYAWIRGTDRIIDVAAELKARGRRDVLFVLAGDMGLRGSLPGRLGQIARRDGTLADYAAERGVSDLCLFLGHVADPESVLVGCDALAKPSRNADPWGRDILEAMALGKPVIAIGKYDRFVETGATGILLDAFGADAMAETIVQLLDDRSRLHVMALNAASRAARLCDGKARAAELVEMWRTAIAARACRTAA